MMSNEIYLPFDIEKPRVKILKAGAIACMYEHGKVRYLRFNGVEMFRTIYTAVRDENWNTATYEISDEEVIQEKNAFRIRYVAIHTLNNIKYRSSIEIEASVNELSFAMNGEALTSFSSNRVGICLLHNISSIAGKDVKVTTPDGSAYLKTFPQIVSPHQPIKNIKQLRWKTSGVSTALTFEGDIFETEDQRNWSDSSFKTYSRPLDLPHPFNVKQGERSSQQISINFGEADVHEETLSSRVTDRKKFPSIGYGKSRGHSLSEAEISALLQLPFDHYRTELDFAGDWETELEQATQDAQQLGTSLFLVCLFTGKYVSETNELARRISEGPLLVRHILVVDNGTGRSMSSTYSEVFNELKSQFPNLNVGYGTNGHFADLNRNLPHGVRYDFVSFGLTPQAHATDTISLLENLDNQHDDLHTLQHHLGDVSIFVSPITFKGRKASLAGGQGAPPDFDARQHTAFGAAWLMRCLRNFAGNTVTLFDATGYKGIVSDDHIRYGRPSPFYQLLSTLNAFNSQSLIDNNNESEIAVENAAGERMIIKLDESFVNYRKF